MEVKEQYYTNDQTTLILIALLKKHNVKKIVISPGATNISLVGSIQNDSYFEIYSCVDERSAAYMACGLAEESGESVALSCTGATASRNYIPALTEAYYRKLPILAITSMVPFGRVGHLFPQAIDRSNPLNDIAKLSIQLPAIHTAEDEWECNVNINKALLELNRAGGGPVHINLATSLNQNYDVHELPSVRTINRVKHGQSFPVICEKRIAVFVGTHSVFSNRLTLAMDNFCENYNAVILCDHTSNYKGKYGICVNLICDQKSYIAECRNIDLLIHIGNVSGAYASIFPKSVWRINPDGEVRDFFKKLTCVFEMEEIEFFELYNSFCENQISFNYFNEWKMEKNNLLKKMPDLPFSNIWMASILSNKLPSQSVLFLGILNSLRAWNFFDIDKTINAYSNTGGFGIDGCVSTVLGASLASPDKLFFCILGDLGFFYDMNACGNRHWKNNVRLLIVNNGKGTEFRNYSHPAASFGESADTYMAAAGHYGNQSSLLVKDFATNLGFEYLTSSSKEEFLSLVPKFTSVEVYDKPIILETFTNSNDESVALNLIEHLEISQTYVAQESVKKIVKSVIGEKGINFAKTMLRHK